MEDVKKIINDIFMIFVDAGWKLSVDDENYVFEKTVYKVNGNFKINKKCKTEKLNAFLDVVFAYYYDFDNKFNICGKNTHPIRWSFRGELGKSLVKVNNYLVKNNIPVKYTTIFYS